MGRELEYKFSATAESLEKIAAAFGGFRRIQMQTTYFDTPDRRLSAQKKTLRIRKENEESIVTLKAPLPDGSRAEWECHADSLEEGLQKLPQSCDGPLEAVCGAKFVRRAALITLEDATVELALDLGVLTGGGRELPLCEAEVEYKAGSEEAARRFAEKLAADFGLKEEKTSKFARAMALR